MSPKPRWRIMLVFTVLATLFCILIGTVMHNMFYSRLTDAIDEELTALADELATFVDLSDQKADLIVWKGIKTKSFLKNIVSVELYDLQGHMVESYGDLALKSLHKNKSEAQDNGRNVRVLCKQLVSHGRPMGWLQITIPTRGRDRSVQQLTELMQMSLPAVLFVFGLAGYFFSGRAVKPIEQAFAGHKRFMSDASHELKTPLTIAQTHSEVLEAELEEQNISTKRVQIIRNAHGRIHRLIDDLLLLTKAESQLGATPHETDEVSAKEMVESIVEDFREKYKSKGIVLKTDFGSEDAIIRCDPENMRRAVSNLVENAWRYTAEGGQVIASVHAHHGEAKIAVADTGIGIAASAVPFLFDRFYRVDASRSSKEGGAGLGLSIVKAIVEKYGGTVSVASTSGTGSTFTIAVPCTVTK